MTTTATVSIAGAFQFWGRQCGVDSDKDLRPGRVAAASLQINIFTTDEYLRGNTSEAKKILIQQIMLARQEQPGKDE